MSKLGEYPAIDLRQASSVPTSSTNLAHYPAGPDRLIFAAPEGGPIRRNTFRSRFWLPAVADSVGQPMRFHDLRHNHVALLIAEGAHPAVIASPPRTHQRQNRPRRLRTPLRRPRPQRRRHPRASLEPISCGRNVDADQQEERHRTRPDITNPPPMQGIRVVGTAGLEPTTSAL